MRDRRSVLYIYQLTEDVTLRDIRVTRVEDDRLLTKTPELMALVGDGACNTRHGDPRGRCGGVEAQRSFICIALGA